MDDITFVDEKKYKRMKRIVKVSSIVAGIALAFILYIILSLYLPAWLRHLPTLFFSEEWTTGRFA